ncbi:uncharacterized protein CANTADRAFT_45485 [Suhomyces tanzawaensis NRRL Y-17324]|uniref:Uncharacterized protein n=1 Tax=Suhomyces tanzawaensis NRRL Y-17324 TaxID=984487 RepID=A0A1E4SP82_9ASCO|nr:uncharacterized protein CANTADRAFT_45485 [Suhomyces tanzawaensis NRRL Y-17324]ODV81340.1 hypothetical protein CANTADRAFT_45485 [Suhomyces tanzawaensis NRRL Y-17324]
MSFNFPKFSLQSLQDSLPSVDLVKESFSKVNTTKTVDLFKESLQPFTSKTTQLISSQLHQVQQLASLNVASNIEISELPADYLELETNCDLLLKLYTDLIVVTDNTYAKVSYDYPPGNYALTKLKDANVGGIIGSKFQQLRNVSSPQELEKILLGSSDDQQEDTHVQTTSAAIPRTLYGQLSVISQKHSDELKASDNALSLALLQVSSAYHEIAAARLDQDKHIMDEFNAKLVAILNDQFVKVNELRKRVYSTRSEFDVLRAKFSDEEEQENEELIAKEDELVSATEEAVLEMKKLLKPSKNVNLLKVFVKAQKEWLELSAKKLDAVLSSLDKIDFDEEDDLE